MTAQEAIKILNPDADVVWKAYDGKDLERCNEACRIACVALAKTIPQKPIKLKAEQDVKIGTGTWKAGTTVYKCPCCNSFISRSSVYCDQCAKALDWSDD